MLCQGLGEAVLADALVINKVVVTGILGGQGGAQAVKAGVCNGAGSQTNIGIGIVGVLLAILCAVDLALIIILFCVHDSCVTAQVRITTQICQAVVEYRCNGVTFQVICGFLFDNGCHNHHFVNGKLMAGNILATISILCHLLG